MRSPDSSELFSSICLSGSPAQRLEDTWDGSWEERSGFRRAIMAVVAMASSSAARPRAISARFVRAALLYCLFVFSHMISDSRAVQIGGESSRGLGHDAGSSESGCISHGNGMKVSSPGIPERSTCSISSVRSMEVSAGVRVRGVNSRVGHSLRSAGTTESNGPFLEKDDSDVKTISSKIWAPSNGRESVGSLGAGNFGRHLSSVNCAVTRKSHGASGTQKPGRKAESRVSRVGSLKHAVPVRQNLDDRPVEPHGFRPQGAAELWKAPLLEKGPPKVIRVAQNGRGNFLTVQAAVDSIPLRNAQRIIIQIQAGVYREKVFVPYNKPFITFYGSGVGGTLITWNDTATTVDHDNHTSKFESMFNSSSGSALYGTMQSATVSIFSDGFVAQRIAFENSAPSPKPGAVGAQAVAFLIGGDRAAFYYCRFLGAQDTLYDYTGRHYYMNCYIQGSIDFIFGNGRSLFESCELHSIATKYGAIAAHQRLSPEDNTGFSFAKCTVTGSGQLYLGRAWSPYARIVFAWTYLANIIQDEGWSDFGDPHRQSTTYFGQYNCSGPGSDLTGRAPWAKLLNQEEALPYLTLDYINGSDWLGRNPYSASTNGN